MRTTVLTRALLLVLAGMCFGWLASAANHGHLPGSPHVPKVLGNDWAWLCAAFVAAWPARGWTAAFRRVGLFLIPAVVAYYVSDLFAGTYDQALPSSAGTAGIDGTGLITDVIAYIVIGLLTSAGLALLVTAIHRGGLIGLVASLVLPAYLVYKGFGTARISDDDAALQVVATWVGIAGLAAGVAVILLGARRWSVRYTAGRADSRGAP